MLTSLLATLLTLGSSLTPSLGEVRVRAKSQKSLADRPLRVEVLRGLELRRSGSQDVAEALEEHTGVEIVRSFAGAGVSLMGLDPKHVLVLVDGQRVPGQVDGTTDLSRLPIDRVERIEVHKGPGSSVFGSDALGGVVNVVTRRAERAIEGSGRVERHSLGGSDLRARLATRGEAHDLALGAGWRQAPAYDLTPGDVGTSGAAFDTLDVDARGGLALGELDVRANVEWMRRATDGVDLSATGAVFDRRNRTETLALGAELEAPLLGGEARGVLRASSWADAFLYDQRLSTALDRREDALERLGEADLSWRRALGEAATFTVGAAGLAQGLSSPRLDGGASVRGRVGAYARAAWRPTAWLDLEPSVRVDVDTQFGVQPAPGLALRARPADGLTLRVGWGLGFRAPSFRELLLRFENVGAGYLVEGTPTLRPERSHGFTAGAEVALGRYVSVEVGGYLNLLGDLIDVRSLGAAAPGQPARFGYVNVASARTMGAEVSVRFGRFAGLSLELGYALLFAEDLTLGRPLEGRPTHRLTPRLSYRAPRLETDISVRAALVGARPYFVARDADGALDDLERAAPYATLDVRIQQPMGEHLSLVVGADNLLDAGDPVRLPIAPRRVHLGLDARF